MKSVLIALGLVAALSATAWAGPCDQDIGALKAQLVEAQPQPEVKAQVEDMVRQIDKLCAAGNDEAAADVISDAMSMLATQ